MSEQKKKSQANVPEFDAIARIRELIDARGWSMYELSSRAGLASSTVQTMILRGNQPSLTPVKSICGALNISLQQFFCTPEYDFAASEEELLTNFNKLTSDQQKLIRDLVANMATPN